MRLLKAFGRYLLFRALVIPLALVGALALVLLGMGFAGWLVVGAAVLKA